MQVLSYDSKKNYEAREEVIGGGGGGGEGAQLLGKV